MTHILVKDGNNDLKAGMVDAGDHINTWMQDYGGTGKDHRNFFEDLFDQMVSNGNLVTIRDGHDKQLTKQNQLRYNFSGGGLTIRPVDDRKTGNNCNMTIPIPRKSSNIIDTYVGTVADQIVELSGGNSASTAAKKYLLAVIFLNRCQ